MTSLAILLAAMFLHELGHASMALVLGVKCYSIRWVRWNNFPIPFAMGLSRDIHPVRAIDALITMAGPVTSFALLLLACLEHMNTFALANLSILVTCFLLPGSDFWRLFQYSGLRTRAQVNRYLMGVCQ
jgi:hypothetical protein